MSEPIDTAPSFISRAEHDAAMFGHRLFMHKMIIIFVLIAAGIIWFSYAAKRDFQQFVAVRNAEKALAATNAPAATQVPTAVIIPKSGFLGRGGGSGKQFIRRMPPTQQQPISTTTKDPKTGVETTATVCPAPPPNVTRFDPPTDKDKQIVEKDFDIKLSDNDMLGKIEAPRTRTNRSYGLFVSKSGGDLIAKLHKEPRSNFAFGHFMEIYGSAYRQQSVSTSGVGAAGTGIAIGIDVDVARYKDLHLRPFLEFSPTPSTEIRYGIKVPFCLGAVCP